MSHTPGPWTVAGIPKGYGIERITANGLVNIAVLPRDRVAERRDEVDANAQLIAAAPDLLEACKATLDQIRAYAQDIPPLCRKSVIDHLLATAIAKATGKEV